MASTKKPHMVKKWARPGIDHRSSRVCPNTSMICVLIRSPRFSVRPVAGWPDRMRLVSQSTRLAAKISTTAVISMPSTRRSTSVSVTARFSIR